jgi:hypothetical protein
MAARKRVYLVKNAPTTIVAGEVGSQWYASHGQESELSVVTRR